MIKLVKIEKNQYSFYDGKSRVISVNSDAPLSGHDVESYRENPDVLKDMLNGEFYNAREYKSKTTCDAILYDGTEYAITALSKVFQPEVIEKLEKLSGVYYIIISDTGYNVIPKLEFEKLFEEA